VCGLALGTGTGVLQNPGGQPGGPKRGCQVFHQEDQEIHLNQ